ncbi:MAG TPA: hypothetical protein VFT18_01115 [Gaiellaceae bacterium]|nr:hypothetical protein [Gaiellaceae bacterium]
MVCRRDDQQERGWSGGTADVPSRHGAAPPARRQALQSARSQAVEDVKEEETIEAIALIARLKPGAESRAAELIKSGPPFDPPALGLTGHRVFLSAGEAVFLFEGHEVEWMLDDLVSDPNAWQTHEALDAWRPLIEFPPRIAREAYAWEQE